MKGNKILVATTLFFIYINTYFLFSKIVGLLAIPLFVLTGLTFLTLGTLVLHQTYLTFKEKLSNKNRVIQTIICIIMLSTIGVFPFGVIPKSLFEGKDLLIAQREGAANCMSTFKIKENKKFKEERVCFADTEVKGEYEKKGDTLFFKNIDLGRVDEDYYKFAVFQKGQEDWNKNKKMLNFYESEKDTEPRFLLITKNEFYNQ
jgi:hypothetical protein